MHKSIPCSYFAILELEAHLVKTKVTIFIVVRNTKCKWIFSDWMLFLSKFDLESWMIKNFCIKALSIRIGSSLFYLHSNKCKTYWKTIKWKPSSLGERNFSITFEGGISKKRKKICGKKKRHQLQQPMKALFLFSHWSHPPPFLLKQEWKGGKKGKKAQKPWINLMEKAAWLPDWLWLRRWSIRGKKKKAKTRILASWSSFQRNTNYSQAQLQIWVFI